MTRAPVQSPVDPLVRGAATVGMTKKVTDQILRALRQALQQDGQAVKVRSMRFLPSSRTETESGAFQVVANTVIETTPGTGAAPRIGALDAVVTVGRAGRGQTFEGLTIPALQRARA